MKTNKEIYNSYISLLQQEPNIVETKNAKKKTLDKFIRHYQEQGSNNQERLLTQISENDVSSFIYSLNKLETTTINFYLSHLKCFFCFLEAREITEINVSSFIKPIKKPKRLAKNISAESMNIICDHLSSYAYHKSNLTKLCNRAIVEFLYATGVRGVELRAITLNDLYDDLSCCHIATAKGGVARAVYLLPSTQDAIRCYLSARGLALDQLKKKEKSIRLFVNERDEPLTRSKLIALVREIGIDLLGYPITPGRIRHTFATEILRATNCVRTTQILLGHKKISSTAHYCHLNLHDTSAAINQLHPIGDEL